jgi:hypothetical protein
MVAPFHCNFLTPSWHVWGAGDIAQPAPCNTDVAYAHPRARGRRAAGGARPEAPSLAEQSHPDRPPASQVLAPHK